MPCMLRTVLTLSFKYVLLFAATWKYLGYTVVCPHDRQISKRIITAWCNLQVYSYYNQFIIQYIITIIINIFTIPNAQQETSCKVIN
jgi:hypothetical protein